jgi:hypothetical protein
MSQRATDEVLAWQYEVPPRIGMITSDEKMHWLRHLRQKTEAAYWMMSGGDLPSTISDATFRAGRLKTMRMRLSAAYKGVNALLMKEGAQDLRSGQKFSDTVVFGEDVDIHHIFPKKWCEDNKFKPGVYDSIINKTPLAYRTNRIIGGAAPSVYLNKLLAGDKETPPIATQNLRAISPLTSSTWFSSGQISSKPSWQTVKPRCCG